MYREALASFDGPPLTDGRLEMTRRGKIAAALAVVGVLYYGSHHGWISLPPGLGGGSGAPIMIGQSADKHDQSSPESSSSAQPPATPKVKPGSQTTAHASNPPPKPGAVVCQSYSATTFGVDVNKLQHTGGGDQLVTVTAARSSSIKAKLVAWQKQRNGCWTPANIGGAPQVQQAQLGRNGVMAYTKRRPGSGTTPLGLFPFGTTVYGNAAVQSGRFGNYNYHQLQTGDYWVEDPGNRQYDTFQHVSGSRTPPYALLSEKLWTTGQAYEQFVDIKMPTRAGHLGANHAAGIFLHHNSNSGSTDGCIALPDGQLEPTIKWLNPQEQPHILIELQS